RGSRSRSDSGLATLARVIALPPGLRLVLGKRPLPIEGDEALRARVDDYNAAHRHHLLPDALNFSCLNVAEVMPFVHNLVRLPEATQERLKGQTLDLSSRTLRLFPLDAVGVYTFTQGFDLIPHEGHWYVNPGANPLDAAYDLECALYHLDQCNREEATRWGGRVPSPVQPTPAGVPPGFAPNGQPAITQKTQYAMGVLRVAAQAALPLAPLTMRDRQTWDGPRLQHLADWLGQRMMDVVPS
ncbi:MAG: hypothetical protein AAGA56_18755, partial [Myxococcota bacterium]